MIQFFRSHFTDRLLWAIILLLLIRVPFLILYSDVTTAPELYWNTLGNKVVNGGKLYAEIIDNTAPLSAWTYSLMARLSADSIFLSRIVALVLLLIQALLFNFSLFRYQMQVQNTQLPALFAVLLGNLYFDYIVLSPTLLGNTFLVIALHYIFKNLRYGTSTDGEYLLIGTFISIASLFYLPMLLFVGVPIFTFLLYTSNSLRQYFLIIFGVAMPYALVMTYFFYVDVLYAAVELWLLPTFQVGGVPLVPVFTVLLTLALPSLVIAWSLLRLYILADSNLLYYQRYGTATMIYWLAIGYFSASLAEIRAPFQFVVLFPPMSFFMTVFFLSFKRIIWQELTGILVISFLIIQFYIPVIKPKQLSYELMVDELIIAEKSPFTQKKVLALGADNLFFYKNNLPATAYLHPELSKNYLKYETYQEAVVIYLNFSNDLPDYIVDDDAVIQQLFERMPILAQHYVWNEKQKYYEKR